VEAGAGVGVAAGGVIGRTRLVTAVRLGAPRTKPRRTCIRQRITLRPAKQIATRTARRWKPDQANNAN
jgi:hypothetical protein